MAHISLSHLLLEVEYPLTLSIFCRMLFAFASPSFFILLANEHFIDTISNITYQALQCYSAACLVEEFVGRHYNPLEL